MMSIRNKQRPFRILKYLYENTDENHPVSTPKLVKIFQAEDAHANRKTVKDDIDVLKGEGFDIATIKSRNHSFFMASRKFEVMEIKLLIDAVTSATFISEERRATLIGKLTSMMSKPQAEKVHRQLYTAGHVTSDTRQCYYIADVITDAINCREKIFFQYSDYNGEKEKRLCRGGAIYTVSPYAIVWNDNHFYVFGYSDHEQKIMNYRMDRMCNIGKAHTKAVPLPEGVDVAACVQKQFCKFAGDDVEVILECQDDTMKYIIDQFGEEVETWKVSKDTFQVKVNVADCPAFYGWVFLFEGKIRIVGSEETVEKFISMVKAANRMFRKKRKKKSE